MFLARHQDIT